MSVRTLTFQKNMAKSNEVFWTSEAVERFESIVLTISREWSAKEGAAFISKVFTNTPTANRQPLTGNRQPPSHPQILFLQMNALLEKILGALFEGTGEIGYEEAVGRPPFGCHRLGAFQQVFHVTSNHTGRVDDLHG